MKSSDKILVEKRLELVIKNISHSQIENRLIAIGDLKEIGSEYPFKYDNIIQILTVFIKNNRSLKILSDSELNPISEINIDIQAALKIITNPDIDEYLRRDKIDLSYTDIRGANLHGACLKKINLQQSILYRASLIDANLENANLNGAILSATNFCGANLSRANLSGAILSAANLNGTNLTYADLRGANLFLAKLQGANLNGANLDGANLREADFDGNKANPKAQN